MKKKMGEKEQGHALAEAVKSRLEGLEGLEGGVGEAEEEEEEEVRKELEGLPERALRIFDELVREGDVHWQESVPEVVHVGGGFKVRALWDIMDIGGEEEEE